MAFRPSASLPVYEKYNARGYYVAISDADRHPKLDYAATIHHGIDMSAFSAEAGAGDYLLFFGRIHPHKGTAEAIEVAQQSGMPLVVAGIIQDQEYFDARVAPHIDDEHIRFLGPVGPDERGGLLSGARALLHLISFDEPFGFSVVEAMASGTPVIAHERGSMTELIEEGSNGFLVNSTDEAVAAVEASAQLDGLGVRESVSTRFDVNRMVDEYVAVYETVVKEHGRKPVANRNGG